MNIWKGVKNGNFLKGLVHGSTKKIEHFTMSAFLAKHGRKDRFFNILNRKEYFLHTKSEVLKPSKNSNF